MSRLPAAPERRRILLEALVIAALGAIIGLSLHWRLVLDAFEGRPAIAAASADASSPWPAPVGLEEVEILLAEGALAVDARSREAWREGHLPGALALPLAQSEEAMGGVLGRISPETTLVVYCSGYGCPDSFDLAVFLMQNGFRDVRVFEGGFPQWRDAGLPVTGEDP